MKQWNGLLKKEWISMKWSIVLSLLGVLVLLFLFPLLLAKLLGESTNIFEYALVIAFLAAIANLFIPLILFWVLVEKEMKRSDLWLHSTASIYQLIGVKAFFAMVIGVVSFSIPTIVLATYYFVLSPPGIAFNVLLVFGLTFLSILIASSIPLLSTGILFWVLYRWMKPFLKGFSILIAIGLFFLTSYVYGRLIQSQFYETYVMVGPINVARWTDLHFESEYFSITPAETVVYSGQFVFDAILTVGMFLLAVGWFDKKVRY